METSGTVPPKELCDSPMFLPNRALSHLIYYMAGFLACYAVGILFGPWTFVFCMIRSAAAKAALFLCWAEACLMAVLATAETQCGTAISAERLRFVYLSIHHDAIIAELIRVLHRFNL